MNYTVRALTAADEPIVWAMLMYAAHEPSLEAVQQQPCLARYASDWGRAGDMGFAAYVETEAVGAAWLRLWATDDRGFGYVDDPIPELAMAVCPNYRGKGVGTALLTHVLEAAQAQFPAVSLNVRATNPALNLYQRLGFVKVAGSEAVNRVGGISFNMVKQFIEDKNLTSLHNLSR